METSHKPPPPARGQCSWPKSCAQMGCWDPLQTHFRRPGWMHGVGEANVIGLENNSCQLLYVQGDQLENGSCPLS